jgi:curved DNA-binding protein
MGVQFKDYYETLGVARSATDEEIRKAFRKLARQFHPDVAKDKKNAEARFKEINEAYEVLGDAEKRRRYDELGANWKQGSDFQPPPGWGGTRSGTRPGGFDSFNVHFGGTGFSDFFEQLFGGRNRSHAQTDTQDYSERGQDVEADILVTLEEAQHGSTRSVSLRREIPCDRCGGSGHSGRRPCPECGGSGSNPKTDTHQIRIPAGVREGQRLRLAGRGEGGIGDGPSGDLYLRVRFAKHPEFRVEGGDLYHDLALAPWEAVLGTQVSIPTLKGKVNIRIPAGSQSGQKLRVRGHGLADTHNNHGDLYAVIDIQTPDRVEEPERALWEQLARESRFRPRD